MGGETNRTATRVWAAVAAFLSLFAIPGIFTISKTFFVRDLSTWFRPHHAWFQQTLREGQLPFWNPYLGCGYSTVGEPALQTFFPLTLPLRFVPGVVGFNLIVALPFAIAALGVFRLLARRCTAPAACLGAVVFAASGPVLSTGNMPNLAWSCALMPWVLVCVDALAESRTHRRAAVLAAVCALTLLAGEPVTFVATAVLALAYAGFTGGLRTLVATAVALGCSALLSAVQLAPTMSITSRSIRGTGALGDIWSLHPLRLFETVAPFVFGKYTGRPHEITSWLFAFNDARDPLLFSIYLGVPALLLAAVALAVRDRWAWFWGVVGLVALVASFGLIPSFGWLRFPSKHVTVTALAVAVLAAAGWDALSNGRRRLVLPVVVFAALLVLVAGSAWILVSASPDAALSIAARWATALALPGGAAQSLLNTITGAAPRLLGLALLGGATLVLAISARREARMARGLLFVLIVADLVVVNAPLNPTMDAATLAPFDWVELTKTHAADRLFVARDYLGERKPKEDVPPPVVFPLDRPILAYQAVYETALGSDLTASAVPATLSREVTGLRPREYLWLLQQFDASDRGMKYRFLSWAGTRYFLTMAPPPMPAAKLAELPIGSLALYESAPSGSRAFVATRALVEPDPRRQIERLFDPAFDPSTTVLLERGSPAMGAEITGSATIIEDAASSLTIEATAPSQGGWLVLLDSFDPGWSATVDGEATEVLRADGAFRAVRLEAGDHTVRLRYAPRSLVAGAIVSAVSWLLLGAVALGRSGIR